MAVVPRHDVEVTKLVTPQKPVEAMALARPVIIIRPPRPARNESPWTPVALAL